MFRDVCFCAPTRVRAKFVRFHISAYGYVKNAPDFTFPNKNTPKTCPVLYPDSRRGTFRGVCNTPLHGYVQNLAGFIFPHTDPPKTYPILPIPTRIRPKRTRFYAQAFAAGHFGAYAFAPLRGYVQNLTGFTFPHTDTPKTHPILDPTPCRRTFRGVCFCALHGYMKKPARFYTQKPRRGAFWGVCNTPLHGYVQNLAGFIFPHTT